MSETVYKLIYTLWNICVLRYGPQALPSSRSTLSWIVILHVLSGTAFNLPHNDLLQAMQLELSALLFTYVFIRVAVLLGHRVERFEKTLGAMLGRYVIIGSVGLLLELLLVHGLGLGSLWISTSWLLRGWSIIVSAHIFRHLFTVDFFIGFIIAFGFFYLGLMVMLLVQEAMLGGL